jgi:hypothetical protein
MSTLWVDNKDLFITTWVLPLGVKFAIRSELCPLGVDFVPFVTTLFTPRGMNEHILLYRRMEGQTEYLHPYGPIKSCVR